MNEMTLEEAIKNFKPKTYKLPEPDTILIQKAYELFAMIQDEQAKQPLYQGLNLSDAFMNNHGLPLTCDIYKVEWITFNKVAYRGTANDNPYLGTLDEEITIPIKNLNLTREEVSEKCYQEAKRIYLKRIKEGGFAIQKLQEGIDKNRKKLNELITYKITDKENAE